MSYIVFFNLINDNFLKLILALSISLLIYLPIIKWKRCFILSPYILSFYNSIFSTTVLLFLAITNSVTSYYFSQYITTEILFYIGFLPNIRIGSNLKRSGHITSPENWIFRLSFLFFIVSQLGVYLVWGIPLFLDSRLEQNFTGGGTGIILRINQFFVFPCLYKLFYDFFILKKKSKALLFFLLYFIVLLLSGSKSSILFFFTFFYTFGIIHKFSNPEICFILRKNIFKIFLLVSIFIFIAFLIKSKNGFVQVLVDVLFRFVCQGDSIFLAYPNGEIDKISSFGTGRMIFSNLLITLRLLPSTYSFPNIGLELYQNVVSKDFLSGSVLPHNILGYIQYGYYGSFIFSFISGITMNFLYSVINSPKKSSLGNVILIYIYMSGPYFVYALNAFFSNMTGLFIFGLLLIIFLFIFYFIKGKDTLCLISES